MRPTFAVPSDDLNEVVRVLLIGQVAVLITSVVEALLFVAILGPTAAGGLVLACAAAVVTLAAIVGLGRRATWAPRLVVAVESLVLLGAAIDTVLALVLAGQPIPLVAMLTRIVLPVAVLALLRRPARAAPDPTVVA